MGLDTKELGGLTTSAGRFDLELRAAASSINSGVTGFVWEALDGRVCARLAKEALFSLPFADASAV